MSKLAKINKKRKISKKALSIIVGYVLLIVFASVMGVIVYKWQKTYVPQDEYASCPEAASLLISNVNYDCDENTLTFDIKNNGQFDVGGYFIYVKDSLEKTIATLEISRNNTDALDPKLNDLRINGIKLGMTLEEPELDLKNDFAPGETETETYTLVGVPEPIYTVEIIPIRWQTEGNKEVLASCKEVRIVEEIGGCQENCVPVDPCGTRECGTMLNNCYDEVPCGAGCELGEFCDSTGQCVVPEVCTLNCDSLGYVCGVYTICGVEGVVCGTDPEGLCDSGYYCDEVSGHCILGEFTCDGTWNLGEESPGIECDDDEDLNCVNCVCIVGYDPDGMGGCEEITGEGQGCLSHCLTLGLGYTRSTCVGPPGQCTSTFQGFLVPSGNYLCDSATPRCCCGRPL